MLGRPRARRTRLAAVLLFTLLIWFIYVLIPAGQNVNSDKCVLTRRELKTLTKLAEKTEDLLKTLNLKHFMCYNTLWGALKSKEPLPWSNNIELCLFNEEVSKIEEAYFIRLFKQRGVTLWYESGVGVYHGTIEGEIGNEIQLILFELDKITYKYRRVGWKHRILPPESCESLHCFPPNLVDKPLPQVSFLGQKWDIPRDEIEIQKYLFPQTWWMDIKPEKCKANE